ncbi:MAG: efflux RND transporter periplasmic adaptor subunit [Proteobacteria bacterium]|nr:MAG: efflux RND transporter periplasmic adaptor subunit [Pseudomonadota bacterium]QKK11045.1 MAG: efflux RND transporter periplasmic adaptor subunit [Pseudomonadota bacterium]
MNRGLRNALVVATIAALVTGAYLWFSRPQPIPVVLHSLETGPVQSTVANTRAGTVKACNRARLSPAAGGQVTQLTVREGARVEKGQLLLELWNEDVRAEVLLAQRDAIAAVAKADEVCLQAEVADREAQRQVRLKQQNLISEDQVDRAVTDARARQAGCRAARTVAGVSAARVEVANAALERTRLYAPFTGVVAEVTGEVGEYATPSPPGIPTPPAIDLIDDQCRYISAPIDEVDAPAIQVGMPAKVSLDAFRGKPFPGRVRRIAPYVLDLEKQARTVEVEVELTDSEANAALLPGYSADIEVILEMRDNVLRVPAEAVLEGNRVLVLRPADNTLEERTFEPGLANWEFAEVRSGLSTGDRIVLSVDRKGVSAGALVKPEP